MSMKSRLKIAVVTRTNERGFATVVALGIGLSLTLIGLMMVTRSQGDVSTTSSQRAIAKSLAAAETGIVRFQTAIDRNRAIAIYPACGNSSLSDATPCSDTTNPSWFNSAAIPTSATISPAVSAAATRNWQDIDPATSSTGQYRLIDYTYDSVLKSATLTVEGRVEQNVGRGPSTTRLVVTIPIIPSALPAVLPGLWAQNFSAGNNPNIKIAATVLDASEIIGGASFLPTYNSLLRNLPSKPIPMNQPYPLSTTAATVTKNNFPFPPLPGNTYAGNLASIPAASINTKACINTNTTLSYPQDGDVFTDASGATNLGTYNSTDSASAPSRSGNYIYRFDPSTCGGKSLILTNSASLTLGNSINQTFTLFTDGAIDLRNSATLESFSDGSGNAAGVTIYSNDDISLGNHTAFAPSEKLQVYVYGNHQVTLNNNVDMRGFLFAPDSSVTLANSGSFVGTVWAKNFSTNNTASLYQNSLDVSQLTLTNYIESSNKIGSISSWGRQQIN